MAVKTIAELKALWINGFIPDQDDYVDLFDTIDDLSSVEQTSNIFRFTKGLFDVVDNGDNTYSIPLGVNVDDFLTIYYREPRSIPFALSEKVVIDFFDYLQSNNGSASFTQSNNQTVLTISGFNPIGGLGSSLLLDFEVTIQEEGEE